MKTPIDYFKLCRLTARKRGGLCLSKEYINARTPMVWKCGRCGHTWKNTSFKIINMYQWCRPCSMKGVGDVLRNSIEVARNYAAKNNGQLLSREYKNVAAPLEWKCSEGHKFKASLGYLRPKKWCQECLFKKNAEAAFEKRLKAVTALAQRKKGHFIEVDQNNSDYVRLECKEGHRWKVNAKAFLYNESWCAHCAHMAKLSEHDLMELAAKRGGLSLETNYMGCRLRSQWQCKYGHKFSASAENVRQGKWCPVCGSMRKSILSAYDRANKKGGKCLSEIYEGPEYHKKVALFECHKKHTWQMSVFDLRKGLWCPDCVREVVSNSLGKKLES